MAKTLRNAWRIPEVRKKLLYMVLLIVIFRVGAYIPIPGISPKYVGDLLNAENNYITNYFNLMSGGSFGNFTVMALGISPYINSSIIMQLLSIALPPLERLQKEGEMGRKKVERITRYLGVLFAIVMAIGVVFGMDVGATVVNSVIPQTLSNITIIIVLTAGTTFLMWLSELITEIGIGNGSSMIIFVGIIAKLPGTIRMLFDSAFGWNQTPDAARMPVWMLPLIVVGTIFIIAAVTFIDMGERRVPVQYSKRMVGRKMYGGQSSFIPVRVNANGVMPLIFAMTLVNFPQIIITFAPNSGFATWWTAWMGPGSAVYFIVFALLIILFSYFYTMITFNPIELSKNMQAQGAFIPGIRPGRPTSDYLSKISGRLTLVSAVFLALIATLPTLLSKFIPGAQVFGATSLLIMVSVALETNKQLDAQISMRQYKGFLK